MISFITNDTKLYEVNARELLGPFLLILEVEFRYPAPLFLELLHLHAPALQDCFHSLETAMPGEELSQLQS